MESRKPTQSERDTRLVRSMISGLSHEPAADGSANWPNAEMLARITNVVGAAVQAAHLCEEREDSLQNALLRYWQLARENPGKSTSWYLVRCRGFIQDGLKRGTSVDSPKRRRFGCPIADGSGDEEFAEIPELAFEIDPQKLISVLDALKEMQVRLNGRENAILELLFEGNGTRQVAKCLHISPSAVSKCNRQIRSVALQIGLCREAEAAGRKNKNENK
jgi:hypothetical protein